jgi:hypothetical protein
MSTASRIEDVTVIGGFSDILKDDCPWVIGGFALPDGSRWEYREPGAVVIAQGGRLRVTVPRLTRRHDRVQILDNAKHMYFSRERVPVAPDGETAFDLTFRAIGTHTKPGDLYDGFVSWNLLDFETGVALDFFVSNDIIATVYARLPFPGVPEPESGDPKYFALFKELEGRTSPGQPHDYRITYDRGSDTVRWYVDGELVNEEHRVPVKCDGFTVALGLMTEKDIGPQGSTSIHGQGLLGEWSAPRVTRAAGS